MDGELFCHLYRSRRTNFKQNLLFSNLVDGRLYTYAHKQINKKNAILALLDSKIHLSKSYQTHIIWAVTESKNIQAALPFFNQLGVGRLTLFYANRSQGSEKIHLEKLQKILIHSCEQCGRNQLMSIEWLKNLDAVLSLYPKAILIDFDSQIITRDNLPDFSGGVIIGPEGGFSQEEKSRFEKENTFSFGTKNTLKSECAAVSIAALGMLADISGSQCQSHNHTRGNGIGAESLKTHSSH